ncbi:MAG: protein kinase [Phycisphaera sp.]|nr:protein kinase [Phycisphaera sp.]
MDTSAVAPLSETRCPSCGMLVAVPAKFDRYLITEALGRGARGQVYLGYDPQMQRDVALKVNRARDEHSERDAAKDLAAMTTEARALAAISSAHVVSLYGFETKHDPPYIELEYLPGGSVSRMIREKHGVAELDALRIALDVARGIRDVAHAGLVHRDIKPGNLLFDRMGAVKMIDLGFATQVGTTAHGNAVGSPGYMAPELIRGEIIDVRTDIYSLGCTLYHMLTGERVYEDPTPYTGLQTHLQQAPPLAMVIEGLNRETCRIVDLMLQQQPSHRYADIETVIQDLDDLVYTLDTTPREPV